MDVKILRADRTIKEVLGNFERVSPDTDNDASNTVSTMTITTAGAGYFQDEEKTPYIMVDPATGNTTTHPARIKLSYGSSTGDVIAAAIEDAGINYKNNDDIVVDLPAPTDKIGTATITQGKGYLYQQTLKLGNQRTIYPVRSAIESRLATDEIPGIVSWEWENDQATREGFKIKANSVKILNRGSFRTGTTFPDITFDINPGTYIDRLGAVVDGGSNYLGGSDGNFFVNTTLSGRLPQTVTIRCTVTAGAITAVNFLPGAEFLNQGIAQGGYTFEVPAPSGGTAATLGIAVLNGAAASISLGTLTGTAARLTATVAGTAGLIPKIEHNVAGVSQKVAVNSLNKRQGLLNKLGTTHSDDQYGPKFVIEDF